MKFKSSVFMYVYVQCQVNLCAHFNSCLGNNGGFSFCHRKSQKDKIPSTERFATVKWQQQQQQHYHISKLSWSPCIHIFTFGFFPFCPFQGNFYSKHNNRNIINTQWIRQSLHPVPNVATIPFTHHIIRITIIYFFFLFQSAKIFRWKIVTFESATGNNSNNTQNNNEKYDPIGRNPAPSPFLFHTHSPSLFRSLFFALPFLDSYAELRFALNSCNSIHCMVFTKQN